MARPPRRCVDCTAVSEPGQLRCGLHEDIAARRATATPKPKPKPKKGRKARAEPVDR